MKKRQINIDILKCVAVFFVVGVHFFLHTNYYNQSFQYKSIFFSSFVWLLFMTCVPLFIMVTGYLMKNKTYSKSYFLKLFPILGMYIICAAIYTFFDKRQLDVDYLYSLIENIFSFSHYSWYVNMYIGLYLLIPLLNNGFRSLNTKKMQKLVLIILVVLTSFPSTLSIVSKSHPSLDIIAHLVPDFWKELWPISYYLMGSYMSSSNNRIKPRILFLSFLTIELITITVLLFVSNESLGLEFQALPVFLLAIVMFKSILQCQLSIRNHLFEKVILFISNNTLPIYLLSVIGDNYWYPILMSKMGDFSHIFPYSFFIILSLFIQSVFLTVIVKTLMYVISYGIKKVKSRKSINT